MTEADPPAPSPVRWLMLADVWSVYFSFGLTISALAPLVAPILRNLDMTHTETGNTLGAWQLICPTFPR